MSLHHIRFAAIHLSNTHILTFAIRSGNMNELKPSLWMT